MILLLCQVVQALETGGEAAAAVLADAEEARRIICNPATSRLHVATNLLDVPAPCESLYARATVRCSDGADEALRGLMPEDLASAAAAELTSVDQLRSAAHVQQDVTSNTVLGLSTAENATLMQSARGLGSNDPALAALLVAIEHLTGLEGAVGCHAT